MDSENKLTEELQEEKEPFEPAPKWKRVGAWILFGIVVLGIANWLVSIAYPEWPQWVMEQFK